MKLDLSSMKTEAQVHIYENCKCLMEKFADAFDKDQDKLIQFSIFSIKSLFSCCGKYSQSGICIQSFFL